MLYSPQLWAVLSLIRNVDLHSG